MGDAQSAQRENRKDAAAEEDGGKVDEAPAEQNTEDKPLKNNGQISEINGKAEGTIAEVNGHCEDEIPAEAVLSPEEDVAETAKPQEETPLENVNVEINQKESPDEVDTNEEQPQEISEMDTKQNDINDSFRRFFSNIGLKLTVKKGSTDKHEIATDVPDETNKEESNRPEDVEDTTKETKSEHTEENIDLNAVQETYDNDSTTCPTLTDVTSEDVLENAVEKTTEVKEEVESDNVDADEKAQQDTTLEEDAHPTSPPGAEAEVVVSPIKRFFTTGIFSGLRKKKKATDDETTEKELVDMGKKETAETTEVQQGKEEISLSVEATTTVTEHEDDKLKEEIVSAGSDQTTDDGKSPSTDPASITVNEPEITSSQEKVQASPLKKLLSGSSLKRVSKKQRGRKSSDTKLSDSGEHISDQLMSSTESAENHKEEIPAHDTAEAAGEGDGAWASFKKLVTPKKLMKRSSLTNEETEIQGSVEETKPSEGEQISDHSTEEGKKRKDSSVSWEAVLCGSGRRRSRSRKTSDSEDEVPQAENEQKKQESPLESSNEIDEILAPSNKQAGSPSEGDGGSTWKSFKKLVTPKRKAKDEEESKDIIQSDSEVTQDDASFSIKKLLPGRKKRKSTEKQDQVSSDEADREVASGDEDSDTPAVVPLSEFDTVETDVHIETQADVADVPKEVDNELQQDLLDHMAEADLPCDSVQTEAEKVDDYEDTLPKVVPTAPALTEEPEDLTELISKHQQLSDIPEEGVITETMATPASFTEEAARDDTIAEDLIEITSEAITAPEPVDSTLADETEMISAVSQLSESSKTSGNTTPVPVEYDVKHTETLLHQVIETISINPKEVPVCSDGLSSEIVIGSVSQQILETFVKEEPPTILEIHRGSDATVIKTGLNVEELDGVNEVAARAQTESMAEVTEAISTEIVSEVSKEEYDTAEIAVDEVHEVNVSQPEESIKELENTDESQHSVERQSEVSEDVSREILLEGEEIVADEGSLVGALQEENEPQEIDAREAESAATVEDDSKDEVVEQDSEEGDGQMFEKEEISEAIPAAEEETELLTEDDAEKKHKLQVDAAKSEHVEEPEVLDAVLTATLDSLDSPLGEVVSEDIPAAETVTDETTQATENLTEVSTEPENNELNREILEDSVQSLEREVTPETEIAGDEPKEESESLVTVSEPKDAFETELAQDLEAAHETKSDLEEGSQSLEKEVISEEVPPAETVTDELTQATAGSVEPEEQPVEDTKTEHAQEPEVLPSDVTDENGCEVVAELNEASRSNEDQEPASGPQNVQFVQEDHIPEAVDELQTLTAVHVSSVSEERSVQVREKTVLSEVIPGPCTESAAVSHEPEHEVHISAVEASVEGEKESKLPCAQIKSGVVEHAVVGQVITCYLKDVMASIPDVFIGQTSDAHEPLIDSKAGEHEFKETIETATPLVKDEVIQTAEEGAMVMMLNVPLVQSEDNHRIQVQVVDVDIKSAETNVDTVLEVGVTETKEIIDVCHETEEVDKLSAKPEMEEKIIHEENKVIIQEVIQHVKESLTEPVLESVPVNVEQEVIGVMEDSTAVIDEEQKMPKGDLEELKPEVEKPEEDVTTEEVKLSSGELVAKKINKEAQLPQIAQDQIVTPSNTGLVVPQNTGIISSIGNVESPSSLSLEFKLNIQFGQAKAPASLPPQPLHHPASPSPPTERTEPMRQTDVSEVSVQAVEPERQTSPTPRAETQKETNMSEVSVQAVEPERQTSPTPRAENQKQTDVTEVAVQATEITEPEPAILESKERAVIMNQPVLLDVGLQAMETAEAVEQVQSTQRTTPNVQVTETLHTVQQKEKGVFLSQLVLSEAGNQQTKTDKLVKQTEEENDQEVWLDAEEDIYTQVETVVSLLEVEEPQEHQTESDQEEKAAFEIESATDSKIEEEESQQEKVKTGGTLEIESEGEDFAVALEHPQTVTASVTTMEWD